MLAFMGSRTYGGMHRKPTRPTAGEHLLLVLIIPARWLASSCGTLALDATCSSSAKGRSDSKVDVLWTCC